MSDELREMSDYKVLMQFALRTRHGDQREEEFSAELLARLERGRKAEEALKELTERLQKFGTQLVAYDSFRIDFHEVLDGFTTVLGAEEEG